MLGKRLHHSLDGIDASARRVGQDLADFTRDTVIYLVAHEARGGQKNHAEQYQEGYPGERRIHECEAKTGGSNYSKSGHVRCSLRRAACESVGSTGRDRSYFASG